MIPYGRQLISKDDIDSVVDILRSDWLTQGPNVPLFEEAVSHYVGAKYAVATNSATSALHIACLALNLGPHDFAWTSPNTFVASANAPLYCGAKLDFIDIDPLTYNISIPHLRLKLQKAKLENKLPKVIIPVHFAGQSCDMEAIHLLSREYGFRIIEDASHAIGAKYNQEPVGSCLYSDITVFSFHPVKIITTGEGGMALTNDVFLQQKMQLLRSHGITNSTNLMRPQPIDEIWNYQQIALGFNYRMTDIQAALGLSQLKKIDLFIARRHQIAQTYFNAFEGQPITTPWQDLNSYSSFHLYPIRIDKSISEKTQGQLYQCLINQGIAANLHYIPVYLQPYYESLGFKRGYCPEAELYFRETISLPIFPSLTDAEQKVVIECIINSLN